MNLLLDSTVKVSVIVLMALVARALLRRRSVRTRTLRVDRFPDGRDGGTHLDRGPRRQPRDPARWTRSPQVARTRRAAGRRRTVGTAGQRSLRRVRAPPCGHAPAKRSPDA